MTKPRITHGCEDKLMKDILKIDDIFSGIKVPVGERRSRIMFDAGVEDKSDEPVTEEQQSKSELQKKLPFLHPQTFMENFCRAQSANF